MATQKDIDHAFYLQIWQLRKHQCYQCNKWLGNEPSTLYFHHVLGKKKYPQYRHVNKNIVLVCADCHQQAESNIDKTPKIKEKKKELLELHYADKL